MNAHELSNKALSRLLSSHARRDIGSTSRAERRGIQKSTLKPRRTGKTLTVVFF